MHNNCQSNMPFQSKNLSDNDRHYIDNFEETLSNTAVGDLDSISQTEEATLREVKGDLGGINEEKFTSLDGNIRFPIDKAISREGRGIARCVGVVHTSPERVLAWQFHVDSDERRAKHTKTNGFDSGKYPNKTIRDVNFRHQINYSCRKLPFPLQPRDWLVRAVFAPLKNNLGYILATKSISDDDPDIPNDFKRSTLEKAPIRGSLNSLCIFEKLPFGCTKFTYLARVHIGGAVPLVVAEGKLSGHVNNVRIAYDFFERDDEVDKLQRDDFVDNMNNACFLTSDERSLLLRCIPYADHSIAAGGGIGRQNAIVMSASQREKWTRLSDANFAVKKFTKKKEGDSALWGKAKAQIHTSAAEAHAWVWFYCSNFRTKQHMKKQGDDMIRQNIGITDGHTQHIVVQKGMTMGLHTRETKTRLVWGEFNSKLVIAFEPSEIPFSDGRIRRTRAKTNFRIRRDKSSPSSVSPISTRNSNDVEADSNVVQLHYKGVWIFDKKSDNICDVTFVNRIEDKGKLPTKIVNASIGRTLDVVSQLKRFFERNGGAVDQELRYAFMVKIPEVTTNDDQRDIIEEQMGKVDLNDDKWEPLEKDSSAFVKLSKIHVKGESNAWGKAAAAVDANAEEVVAWFWDYCSNERMASAKNFEKNPRELIKAISDNHAVFNTMKSMPWPLHTRQFVFESTWTKREDGGFVYAWRPPKADTHYDSSQPSMGKSKRKIVRGASRGFTVIMPEGSSNCTIVHVQQADAGGHLPAKIMDLQIPKMLKPVIQVHNKFNRDDEIDKIEREGLVEIMRNSDQERYSSSERQLIDTVRKKMEKVSEDLFKPLTSPDFRTEMSIAHVEGENNAYLKCEVILDTSVEECAAYNYTVMSRKRMKINDRPDIVRREVKHINNHTSEMFYMRNFGFGLSPRMWIQLEIWQKSGVGKFYHFTEGIQKSEYFEEAKNLSSHVIRAKATKLLSFEETENDCTNLTCIMKNSIGGIVPHKLVDLNSVGFLSDFCAMREQFSRDEEIDETTRKVIMNYIDRTNCDLTEEEEKNIQYARDTFRLFKRNEGRKKITIDTPNEIIGAVGATVGDRTWVQLNATVRCSGLDALALLMDVESRCLLSKEGISGGTKVIDDEGHTRSVEVLESASTWGGLNHLKLRSIIWKIKEGNKDQKGWKGSRIIVSMAPRVTADVSKQAGERKQTSQREQPRRGTLFTSWGRNKAEVLDKTACLVKIVQSRENECTVEMLVEVPEKKAKRKFFSSQVGGEEGQRANTPFARKHVEGYLMESYDYRVLLTMHHVFLRSQPLVALDQQDGTAIGKVLMESSSGLLKAWSRTKMAKRNKIDLFFKGYKSAKTLKMQHEWFETMLETIILRQKSTTTSAKSLDKVDFLTKTDGYTLGSSFLHLLSRTANEDGAFDSWLRKNPALEQFHHQHRFFRPLMRIIGRKQNDAKTWHKLFISIGTGLASSIDVGSDIYTILYYRSIGEYAIADAMTVFLFMSFGIQIILVIAIHHRNKWRMLGEIVSTMTFTKPGFIFWRVLTNAKNEGHEIIPSLSELMMCMIGEIFAEAIPMTVLQVYALLQVEDLDFIVLGALFASGAFVANTVSYLTYAKDIDQESRRTGRLFYGFIPLRGMRLVAVYGAMHALTFCQLIAKSITIGILVQIGGKQTALAVLSCEVGIYLLYKVLRKDFRYFLPLPQGTSIASSLLTRIAMKIVADFTGILHARHPYEMGGAYWLFNMFYTQIMLFVAVWLGSNTDNQEVEHLLLGKDRLWIVTTCLFLLWVFSLTILLVSCERGFIHTFFQLTRAWEYNRAMFDTGDDEYRMYIFTDHESYFMWYKGEVKEWLSKAWERMHREKKDWFNKVDLTSIPLELVPNFEHESVKEEMRSSHHYSQRNNDDRTSIRRGDNRAKRLIARMLRITLGTSDVQEDTEVDITEREKRTTSVRKRVLRIAASVREECEFDADKIDEI